MCLENVDFKTLWPRQNGRQYFTEAHSLGSIWQYFSIGLDNAWRRPGDKPLSETIMNTLLTHICVTRSQWVNKRDSTFTTKSPFRKYGFLVNTLPINVSHLGSYIHMYWYHYRCVYPVLKHTVYPKKYAHGFCFAVLCCGYTLTDFPISIRLTSLALWQYNDCPSASKATLVNMDKYFMWIHYERLHNHNKAKHNKTVCIFLGIYCTDLINMSRLVDDYTFSQSLCTALTTGNSPAVWVVQGDVSEF